MAGKKPAKKKKDILIVPDGGPVKVKREAERCGHIAEGICDTCLVLLSYATGRKLWRR